MQDPKNGAFEPEAFVKSMIRISYLIIYQSQNEISLNIFSL